MTSTKGIRHRVLAACAASALVCGLAVVPAFAAANHNITGGKGDTTLNLQVDQANISATVPQAVSFSVKGDGEFICPSDAKIVNTSQFGIHVANIKVVTESTPAMNLVTTGDFATTTGTANTFWTTVKPGVGSAVELATYKTSGADTAGAEWNIASGATGNDLALTFAGKIKESTISSEADTKAATITWTVASGDLS